MKLFDIKTKSQIAATGRRNTSQKARKSTNDLNPIQWSKWLYDIRQQLGRGTSHAEAYRDCEQHLVNDLKESKQP